MDRTAFMQEVKLLMSLNPRWRKGQTVFNLAAQIDYPRARSYAGTRIDPYHRDERINDFLDDWYSADDLRKVEVDNSSGVNTEGGLQPSDG